jgi:hypothetical protein
VVISASLRSDPAWRSVGGALLGIAMAGVAALLLLGAAEHAHASGGLHERIFLGLELLWMAVAAWSIAAKRAPDPTGQACGVSGDFLAGLASRAGRLRCTERIDGSVWSASSGR